LNSEQVAKFGISGEIFDEICAINEQSYSSKIL